MPSTSHTASEYALLARTLGSLDIALSTLRSRYTDLLVDGAQRGPLTSLTSVDASHPHTGPDLVTLFDAFYTNAAAFLSDVIARAQAASQTAPDPGQLTSYSVSLGPTLFRDPSTSTISAASTSSFLPYSLLALADLGFFDYPSSALAATVQPFYHLVPDTPLESFTPEHLPIHVTSGQSSYSLSFFGYHTPSVVEIDLVSDPSSTVPSSDYSYDSETGLLTFSTLPADGDYLVACSPFATFLPSLFGIYVGPASQSVPSSFSSYTFIPVSSATRSASGDLLFHFSVSNHAVSVFPVFTLSITPPASSST